MDLKNRKTQIEIGVAIVLIALAGWYFWGRGSTPTDSIVQVSQDPVEAIIGRDLLSALEKMQSVKLDVTFFNEPAYKSLQDTTVEVPKQPIGRRDPFASLSGNNQSGGL